MSANSPAIRSSVLLAIFITLLLPATALADTWTVDPLDGNKACGGSDKVCPTIQAAVDVAGGGDLVSILKGTYAEAVTVGKAVELRGAAAGEVKVVGSGTDDVVRITGDGAKLSTLTIEAPADGGSAVEVASGADNATLEGVVAQRPNASSQNVATVDVAGSATLLRSFVIQAAGSAGTPAIASSGAGGTRVLDSVAVSSVGPAAVFSASEANEVVRSTMVSSHAGSNGVNVLSSNAGARKLLVDSSYLLGGSNGAGLLAQSTGAAAGTISLDVRHVTTTGSAKGVVLDASGAQAGIFDDAPSGSIEATVRNSIVHGTSSANRHAGGLLTQANTAKLTFSTSDIGPTEGNGQVVKENTTSTDDGALFAKNLRLRADAPVIDKAAGGVSSSNTDIDGDPRAAGGGPDLGADEFVNRAPTAAFGITNPKPREGEQVGFVSGSTDPEQDSGGGIVEFRWDFGDGTKETTKVGGAVHAYAKTGTYNVTLQVVDKQGAVSAVTAPQTVTVVDGQPPEVAITAPSDKARLRLTRRLRAGKRRSRPIPLTILGSVRDASGVASVEVALTQTKRDRKRKRRARRSQTSTCWHYSGRVFVRRACDKPIWVKATVRGTAWQLRTRRRLRLRPGRWEVRARATDATGLVSGPFTTAARTLVRFRVR